MTSFKELGLDEELCAAIEKLGFEEPTKIQRAAIPKILEDDQDLIALAQTGTGKTGAFGLGCLQKIDIQSSVPQLLILAPTRELALQTAKELKKFGKKKKGIKSVALYGGTDYGTQRKALKNGCQVIVGTPGRTLDFIRQGKLDVRKIRMVVLDEADEMLKMGFQDDLEAILKDTPENKQSLLFSATMPRDVERMAMTYLKSPERIEIGERNAGISNVSHQYYLIHHSDRVQALKRLVDATPDLYGIIFCRTRLETTDLNAQLSKDGYPVDVLNGDLSQEQRDRVMQRFHKRDLKILIATDVAARGLDVNDLTHVINYNLPDELPVYVHRTGRTGRAGKTGLALSLVSPRAQFKIKRLQRMIGQDFVPATLPSNADILQAQMKSMVAEIEAVDLNSSSTLDYDHIFLDQLSNYSAEELIRRMTVLLGGSILSHYSQTDNIKQPSVRPSKGKDSRRERGSREKRNERIPFKGQLTRCEINLGRQNHLTPNRLMGLVNDVFEGPKPHFGKINIYGKRTVFDIDSRAVSQMMTEAGNQTFEGRNVRILIQPSKHEKSRRNHT